MQKKIGILCLCIIMGIIILTVGCKNKNKVTDTQVDSDTSTKTEKQEETNNQTEINNEETNIEESNEEKNKEIIDTLTKDDIQAILQADEKVEEIAWSIDNIQVFFTKDIGDYQFQLYTWKVGEEKEKEIKGINGNLYDLTFSPDNIYITINEGTSNVYETIIISVEDIAIVDRIVNTGGPIWSIDSKQIAFAILNDKQPSIEIELSGTSDIMLFDIGSKTQTIILEADNNFMYQPISWDETGLKYGKYYFDDTPLEELIYNENDKLENQYDILTENFVENSDKLEIDIKYPIVQNMADIDVQKKVNESINETVDVYKKLYYPDDEFKQTINVNYDLMRKTEDTLSIRFFISLYTEGAAHPNNLIDGVTFDLNTGNNLALDDLFKEDVNYKEKLNKILNDKVNALGYELFEPYKGIEEEQGFYLTNNSLVIYYQEYVYTPHAIGPLLLEVSLDEISDILYRQ